MTKQKNVLITGAYSLLGKYLAQEFAKTNYNLILTYHKKKLQDLKLGTHQSINLDITNKKAVENIINKFHPDIIIHLASISNINFCENHKELAHQINILGTDILYKASIKINSKVFFISSNAIFDGLNSPYKESAAPNPLNYYGITKIKAEDIIMQNKNNVVIRLTTLFGWPPPLSRENDVTFYLKKSLINNKLYLVNDRFFNPLYAKIAAINILKLIDKKFSGIIHLAGKDTICRYTFIQKIKEIFIKNKALQLIPVASSYFPKIAKRPKDATLDFSLASSIINFMPQGLNDQLRCMLNEKN